MNAAEIIVLAAAGGGAVCYLCRRLRKLWRGKANGACNCSLRQHCKR